MNGEVENGAEGCECWKSLQAREDSCIEGREVAPKEHHCSVNRRFPDWRSSPAAPERVGLALSGGGIRSATFNLGVLQKLDELEMLSGVDYLSTVSGGGYIGGFWSAWLGRSSEQKPNRMFPSGDELCGEDDAAGEDEQGPEADEQGPEAVEVRHLRAFSNFLRPRMSLPTVSTGRIVAGALGAVVPSVIFALTVLVFLLVTWASLSQGLSGDVLGPSGWGSAGLMLVLTVLAILASELYWRRQRPELPESRAAWAYLTFGAIAAGSSAVLWWGLWHLVPLPAWMLLRPLPPASELAFFVLATLPAAAWALTGLTLTFLQVVLSRRMNPQAVDPYRARTQQAALLRIQSRLLFAAVGWLIAGATWVGGQWLASVGVEGIVAAATTALGGGSGFALARRLFSAQPNKPVGTAWKAMLRPWIPRLIALASLIAAAVACVALLVLWAEAMGWNQLFWPRIAALVVLGLLIWRLDPHATGFHALYRDRLARSYLGASNSQAPAYATEATSGDDLPIDKLPKRPLHLICCTANDLLSDELENLHRGAQSAVISRLGLQIGDRWRRWAKAGARLGPPSLADAMTASAAAFNSMMGSISKRLGPASTFLLAALGLRLGLWVEGPASHLSWVEKVCAGLLRRMPGLLFLCELFGLSNARSGWVHLSDGAHFENLALYELIRRHCRYILLSDCGSDPDVAFDDFGNAVRRVREDFGVEIDIDLEPLRLKDGIARQPMVAGTICYPKGDKGILLYIKPTLVGDEPADVSQYSQRNEAFPHEMTLDQFYDEAQWEAYRRLGWHITDKALTQLAKNEQGALRRQQVIRLFLEAILAWPPTREDDVAVLETVEREWEEMEARLIEKGPTELRRQVLGSVRPADQKLSTQESECDERELFETLPYVQSAMRLMQAVFSAGDLRGGLLSPSHPRYKGWLNRSGRWATSPLFRIWWPWVAPLYSRPFKLFMKEVFDLPIRFEREAWLTRLTQTDGSDYTLERWLIKRPISKPGENHRLVGLTLPLGPASRSMLVGIAELVQDKTNSDHWWIEPNPPFVPAGLWGLGIGELFVQQLVAKFHSDELSGLWDDSVQIFRLSVRASYTGSATNELWAGAGFKRTMVSETEGGDGSASQEGGQNDGESLAWTITRKVAPSKQPVAL